MFQSSSSWILGSGFLVVAVHQMSTWGQDFAIHDTCLQILEFWLLRSPGPPSPSGWTATRWGHGGDVTCGWYGCWWNQKSAVRRSSCFPLQPIQTWMGFKLQHRNALLTDQSWIWGWISNQSLKVPNLDLFTFHVLQMTQLVTLNQKRSQSLNQSQLVVRKNASAGPQL